jgi:nicotinate-nucleotide pyrophosphorylase (carboxylating)
MTLEQRIRDALNEDLINGRDFTSDVFVDPEVDGWGWIEAREHAIVSGLHAARGVFLMVDPQLDVQPRTRDGAEVSRLQRVLEVRGRASSILRAERTALNFLGHLSGIATRTHEFVVAVHGTRTKILCTRKTLPGLRNLEVEAVRHGGGDAYRTNLSDAVLLKDNHLGILGGMPGVAQRLLELRKHDAAAAERILATGKIEVSSLEELRSAADMGWRQVLLDNFSPEDVAAAVAEWGGRIFLEVSGGVNVDNIARYAAAQPHAISIGAVTHSSRAIDFSLEVEWRRA